MSTKCLPKCAHPERKEGVGAGGGWSTVFRSVMQDSVINYYFKDQSCHFYCSSTVVKYHLGFFTILLPQFQLVGSSYGVYINMSYQSENASMC